MTTALAGDSPVTVLHTGPAARDPIGGVRRIDHENLGRGVRHRLVVPDTARTVPDVPTDALVIDGKRLVVPVERTAGGHSLGITVVELRGMVTAIVELLERVWLSADSTDESAAARLGVSVHTVRRMVADIMNRLGARSRFQAGSLDGA